MRRFLPATFRSATRFVTTLIAVRIALLLAARAGRRLLSVSCCRPSNPHCPACPSASSQAAQSSASLASSLRSAAARTLRRGLLATRRLLPLLRLIALTSSLAASHSLTSCASALFLLPGFEFSPPCGAASPSFDPTCHLFSAASPRSCALLLFARLPRLIPASNSLPAARLLVASHPA